MLPMLLVEEMKKKADERNRGVKVYTSLQYGLDVALFTKFFSNRSKTAWFNWLERNIKFPDESYVKIYGKTIPVPRLRCAYGDPGTSYSFSNVTEPSQPWLKPLLSLKRIVELLSDHKYNFVLVNKYRNGKDYIGPHRDSENDLVEGSTIASISFGASRDFVLQHTEEKKEKVVITLNNGDILLMKSPTNKNYKHSVPARNTLNDIRYNLTFRLLRI